jgi:hypothetical protein
MRGEPVIVRVFGGKGLKRRVWGVGNGVVYITNDEQLYRQDAGKVAIKPIGFPKEDVFTGTEHQSLDEKSIDWSRLVRWQAKPSSMENPASPSTDSKDISYGSQQEFCFEISSYEKVECRSVTQSSMFSVESEAREATLVSDSTKTFDVRHARRFSKSVKGSNKARISNGSELTLF